MVAVAHDGEWLRVIISLFKFTYVWSCQYYWIVKLQYELMRKRCKLHRLAFDSTLLNINTDHMKIMITRI